MKTRQVAILMTLTVVLTLLAAALWQQASAQETTRPVMTARPYQVLTASWNLTDYEMLYILDNENGRLAALKYDRIQNKLIPVGARRLNQDFNTPQLGLYSMAAMQLSNQSGLLYVTDYSCRRVIVYGLNLVNNTLTPQEPVDLKAVFGN